MTKCRCEIFEHPPALLIPAGLSKLPRQIATFPEFRRAMLAAISYFPSLEAWRGRDENDLGIMLLEMWAYVADVLAFYDQVIADEIYLRTAQQRLALRRLVNLLAYRPRPAVAATVELAAIAEGRQPVALPVGTAFRSGAFNGEKPQVFELDKIFTIHPLNNQWSLEAPHSRILGTNDPLTLAILPETEFSTSMPVLIRYVQQFADTRFTQVRTVAEVTQAKAGDGSAYVQLTMNAAIKLPSDLLISFIALYAPTQQASLWTVNSALPAVETVGSATRLVLNNLYPQIKAGDFILVQKDTEYRWFRVDQVDQRMRQASASQPVTINGSSFNTPGVSIPVTRLLLDTSINNSARKSTSAVWSNSQRTRITVHYGMVLAGKAFSPPRSVLASSDLLKVKGQPEAPSQAHLPMQFLVEDKNQIGISVDGSLDFATSMLTLNQGESWTPPLTWPVKLYGNVISASRGETVTSEILGSGDGSQSNQSFTLKKGPLTYLSAPGVNDQGVVSTLKVYVDGVQWREVSSFFGAKPGDPVYILRQDDEGKTTVTFADGRRGARLPSGTNNVLATYRFGAGKAAPPVGGITQLAKPVKGLTSVRNPLEAHGGEDAESSDRLRIYAPRSALLLGRAVSIDDMLVIASSVSGVRATQVEWRWNETRQQPVVQVWYIGEGNLEEEIVSRIRAVSEPDLPVDVEAAQPVPLRLALDLELDRRYLKEKVLQSARATLLDKETGLLPLERVGIGKPLYRSQVFKALLAIDGVLSVQAVQVAYSTFTGQWTSFALTAGAGKYFDIEQGDLVLNAEEG